VEPYSESLEYVAGYLGKIFHQDWDDDYDSDDWIVLAKHSCEESDDEALRDVRRHIIQVLRFCRNEGVVLERMSMHGVALPIYGNEESPASILCSLACLITEWLVRVEGRPPWDRAGLW
jgi:hypothetical protein